MSAFSGGGWEGEDYIGVGGVYREQVTMFTVIQMKVMYSKNTISNLITGFLFHSTYLTKHPVRKGKPTKKCKSSLLSLKNNNNHPKYTRFISSGYCCT